MNGISQVSAVTTDNSSNNGTCNGTNGVGKNPMFLTQSAISSGGCTEDIYGVQCTSRMLKIGEPFSPLHKIHIYATTEAN